MFSKNTQISDLLKLCPVRVELFRADRRTARHDEANSRSSKSSERAEKCYVFICFVWIWEQTAIISLHNINWLVSRSETESVYCAVRTGSLNVILRSAHTVYLCVLCGSENKQKLFPYTTLTDWFL